MPRDRPGEQAVFQFLIGGLTLSDNLEIIFRRRSLHALSRLWTSRPPVIGLIGKPSSTRVGQVASDQQTQVLLLGESFARFIGDRRRNHHFGKDLGDGFGGRAIKFGIHSDNPAECRDTLSHASAASHASMSDPACATLARIGVLDDHHCRIAAFELGAQLQRRIGIVVIVVGELLALQLLCLRDALHMRTDRARRAQRVGAGSRHNAARPEPCRSPPACRGTVWPWSANANHWLIMESYEAVAANALAAIDLRNLSMVAPSLARPARPVSVS